MHAVKLQKRSSRGLGINLSERSLDGVGGDSRGLEDLVASYSMHDAAGGVSVCHPPARGLIKKVQPSGVGSWEGSPYGV